MEDKNISNASVSFNGGDKLSIDFNQYKALLGRYKDADKSQSNPSRQGKNDVPFDIESHITDTDAGIIDYDWINDRFAKYTSRLSDFTSDEGSLFLEDLHTSFNQFDTETKIIAEGILSDIRSGKLFVEDGKSFVDYLNERKLAQTNSYSESLHKAFGISVELIEEYLKLDINDFDTVRRNKIGEQIDPNLAIEYFKFKNGDDKPMIAPIATMEAKQIVEEFFSRGGYDLYDIDE